MTRSANGRPLRFFVMMMAGWIILRVLSPGNGSISQLPLQRPMSLVQAGTSPVMPPAILAASALAVLSPHARIAASGQNQVTPAIPALEKAGSLAARSVGRNDDISAYLMDFITSKADFANRHYASDAEYISNFSKPSASPPPLSPADKATDRWRAGAWLLWRAGSGAANGAVPAGQLGGSQAGLRVDYDLAPRAGSRIAAYGRLTGALQHPAAPESAIGLSIQPIRAIPVSIALERRIALGTGARNANTVMAAGGFGPTAVNPSIAAEGYAQAGIVGFRRLDAFVDGKFSLSTPLPHTPFSLGAALSGGAQPGVSRLDIGPELQVRLPLPQIAARLAVEWRERIAGDARPGSGLAITLAADF